ncbi:MAG: DUF2225 domain-containing protein, partial [Termitinemataceae bacterium]
MIKKAKSGPEDKELKRTFFSKETIRCPVCDVSFHREELLSGGGRLIAGSLTDELHRNYEASAKYGPVYPLIYQPTVCPSCWFASGDADFLHIPAESKERAMLDRENRIADVQHLFPSVDFTSLRDLFSGTA